MEDKQQLDELEALYGVEFEFHKTGMSGAGVAVLETGRLLGGDSSFIYIGDYEVKNNIIDAKIEVTNDKNYLESASGLDNFTLILQGPRDSNCKQFILEGHVEAQPDNTAKITLTRRADLP